MTSLSEAKLPLPKNFIINLEAELDLPKLDDHQSKRLTDVYNFNFNDKGAIGFGLDDFKSSYFIEEPISTLHNFRNSSIDYDICFYKKNNLVLTIGDLNKTNLNNYKTKSYSNIPASLRNEIRLNYLPRTNKFTISFSQVEAVGKGQLEISSLLNLKDCEVKIRFYGIVFSTTDKNLVLKFSKIQRISISTPEHLFLWFENLSVKDKNGRIVTVNNKNEWR